jgi:hypothetical protein
MITKALTVAALKFTFAFCLLIYSYGSTAFRYSADRSTKRAEKHFPLVSAAGW